jgi:hypothetical protein
VFDRWRPERIPPGLQGFSLHEQELLLLVYCAGGDGTPVELPVSLPVCGWSGNQGAESILVELPGGVPRERDEAQQDMICEQVEGGR